ncbi:hypothetical protein CsSME_00011725 [Camellia sinensis var. sinensis]
MKSSCGILFIFSLVAIVMNNLLSKMMEKGKYVGQSIQSIAQLIGGGQSFQLIGELISGGQAIRSIGQLVGVANSSNRFNLAIVLAIVPGSACLKNKHTHTHTHTHTQSNPVAASANPAL